MNPLQRTLIEKVGNDNGFEHVLDSEADGVTLASARHPTRVWVDLENGAYHVRFHATSPTLLPELQRSFPDFAPDWLPFQNEKIRASQSADRSSLTMLPSTHNTDGFFIARMRRKEK